MSVAVIADIVGSRQLEDRAAMQALLESTLREAEEILPASARAARGLQATVGDELQGLFPSLRAAVAATLLYQLCIPEGIELRFGIGCGEVQDIPSAQGSLSEGPAWWSAREAIEHVEDLARRQVPHARSWVRSSELADADLLALTNAGLLARDRVIGRWSPRVRRLVAGRLAGATQLELAEREEISQSAVSQTLAAAGATAITAGYESLVDGS